MYLWRGAWLIRILSDRIAFDAIEGRSMVRPQEGKTLHCPDAITTPQIANLSNGYVRTHCKQLEVVPQPAFLLAMVACIACSTLEHMVPCRHVSPTAGAFRHSDGSHWPAARRAPQSQSHQSEPQHLEPQARLWRITLMNLPGQDSAQTVRAATPTRRPPNTSFSFLTHCSSR
jgi:hypothetical protein